MLGWKNFYELLVELAVRNLKIRYKKTYVGFLWTFFIPLIQVLVIGVIFSRFIGRENYYVFLFSGLLPWQFYTSSIYSMTTSILSQRVLVKKAAFSREAIPLSELTSHFALFFPVYSLFFIYCVLVLRIDLLLFFSAFLPGVIWIVLFIAGLGLLTSGLNTQYRDVQYLVNASFIPWFYGTPILYSHTDLPQNVIKILYFNPLFSAFSFFHKLAGTSFSVPFYVYGINFLETVLIVGLGLLLFRRRQALFVDYI